MTAIWHDDGNGWRALAPVGFPDEASLHTLIETAPQLLPLAGGPPLVVLGREVQLGANSADLIAVEPNGRLAIIEIKLSRNAEAKRAVIAQVLTYAAYLQGIAMDDLERNVLRRHLVARGWGSIAEGVAQSDQTGTFDSQYFAAGIRSYLESGHFRLVIVLDSAPQELTRLVGYLGSVMDRLLIDLITVAAYEVDGTKVMVPQRVEPEPSVSRPEGGPEPAATTTTLVEGPDLFAKGIERRPESERAMLRRLLQWAKGLEDEGLVRLHSYQGKSTATLLPRLQPDNVGLVTLSTEPRAIWLYRTVFERRAPQSMPKVEALIAPQRLGQGNQVVPTEELLSAMTDAYREAVAVKAIRR